MRRLKAAALIAAIALLACSPKAARQYHFPDPRNKVIDQDEGYNPRVDVLFVVDDSGSMSSHQANVARNIGQFTSVFLKKSVLDYNIGVITTDAGGFASPCCGQLEGNPKIVTKFTPDRDKALADNLVVGTSGSATESPFAAMTLALGPNHLSGWNKGFLRDDADLIVIVITDAEDQSVGIEPSEMMQFLLDLKGDKRKVLTYGAIIPSNFNSNSCGRDDPGERPLRLEEFFLLSSNAPDNVLNICNADFGQALGDFALQIVERTGRTIYLTRQPDADTIRVKYGSVFLPNDKDFGWTFDPGRNAIQLGAQIDWEAQPEGSKVRIFYNKAKPPKLD